METFIQYEKGLDKDRDENRVEGKNGKNKLFVKERDVDRIIGNLEVAGFKVLGEDGKAIKASNASMAK